MAILRSIAFSLLPVFAILKCGYTAPNIQHALKSGVAEESKDVNGKYETSDYAVGFEITPSYGTTSIRWKNGNFTDVARINGTEEYLDAMKYFSKDENRHIHPPYSSPHEKHLDIARRAYRLFRKRIGLPATRHVGIISKMLESLKEATESYLDKSLENENVVVVRPLLNALYAEDIIDAIEYAGLSYTPLCPSCTVPLAPYAAMAGSGLGMCQHYTDTDLCIEEMDKLGTNNTLFLTWTRDYFQITSNTHQSSYFAAPKSSPRHDYPRWDLNLSWTDNLDDKPQEEKDEYMRRFGEYFEGEVKKAVKEKWLDTVIFQGEFQTVVWAWELVWLLEELGQKSDPVYKWKGHLWWGSRGAAEYGFRWRAGFWRG